ncbi:MAG TPA: type II toxin-antitoxin system VapC family toxin [Gemmataceae bacterium]|nr:type II toxin-antitoxin system VapC family toxin [Gemmataceae bacterium]
MANSFYMDASALTKRYIPEKGNDLVDEIFNKVPWTRIHFLNIGAGEILSVLVRRRNAGALSIANFEQAMANFNDEIVRWAAVTRASVTTRLVAKSLPLIPVHSINSTDALTLQSALAIARRLRRPGDDLVLIASDQRLLRAAQAEGMATFDPETQDQAALAGMIGP